MGMAKIKEFAKEHWDDIITVGAVITAECMIVGLYKKYLERIEKRWEL